MRSRRVVLLTPSVSFHPRQLPFCQQSAPVNPLDATLINLPASVANKRLTANLSPLDATLTRNGGGGSLSSTFGRSDVQTLRPPLWVPLFKTFKKGFNFTAMPFDRCAHARRYGRSDVSTFRHPDVQTVLPHTPCPETDSLVYSP